MKKVSMVVALAFLICCVGIAGVEANGAKFSIVGTVTLGADSRAVDLSVVDKNIHSGVPRVSPCDGIATDAFVLQGSSKTGCDNGDLFEVAAAPGVFVFANAGPPAYHFTITTHYMSSGCNSAGTICATPDTGFLTIVNDGPSTFMGVLALAGVSPIANGECPPGPMGGPGTALDAFAGALPVAGAQTFALSPDSSNCGGFNRPTLTALSPAVVWVGLTNSDDVGLFFDLQAEVFADCPLGPRTLVGSGIISKVWGGSSGFNNAVMSTIPLTPSNLPFDLPAGCELSIVVSVRQACTAPVERHCVHANECKARLWFNDKQAASRFDATIENGDPDFFLVGGFLLSTTPGPGPKLTIDRDAGSRCSPFKAFGEWKITLDDP